MRRRLVAFLASVAAAVLISAGTFQMGTPASEAGREAQEVPHGVRLSRPFYLARHEVTQELNRTETWA